MEEHKFQYFITRIFIIGIPLMLQSLLFSSAGFVDNLMVSQLGTAEVAASGIGARIFFFASLFIWGMGSGLGVLLAQYWGANDIEGFKRNLALGGVFSVIASLLFFVACFFFPHVIAGWFTSDVYTLELATNYIALLAIAVVLGGFSIVMNVAMRSIGETRVSLYISIFEIALNIGLNYILIFGHFGAPALGLVGAGIGSVIARAARVLVNAWVIYRFFPALTVGLRHIVDGFNKQYISRFTKITLPISTGALIWSTGIFTFHVILGRIGDTELATMAVVSPLEAISLSFAGGLSDAVSVVIGNALGANKFELSELYSRYAMKVAAGAGLMIALTMLLAKPAILSLYSGLDAEAIRLLELCFPAIAISIFCRTLNITLFVGILRSGGDSKFCLNTDVICQWVWAIPASAIAAIWFEFSLPVVLMFMVSEEVVKMLPATKRVFGKKWVNNLTLQKEAN